MRIFLFGLPALFGFFTLVAALVAQEKQPEPPTIRETFKFVLAPVTVTDKDGRYVSGLTASDFRLYDNGKQQKIVEDVTFHPLSMVIAVQANAGMEKVIPQIQKAASLFDPLVLGENGEVAVLAFDHRIQTLADFTSDPTRIVEAFKKLKPGSTSSRLNDATMQAINLLRNRASNRQRVILLISETRDRASEMRVREVLTAAEFANVVTYSVDVSSLVTSLTATPQPPRPNPIPPEAGHAPAGGLSTPTTQAQVSTGNLIPAFVELFRQVKGIFVDNPLEAYTKYTGGREYSFKTQRALERAIADLGEELHSLYMLTYSPNNQEEAGFHEIEVQVLRPGLKVRTRQGYWLAGKPQ